MGLLELQTMLKNWSKDRPILDQHNDLETVQSLLLAEIKEFEESPDPTELADIIVFSLTIANLMGWDMDEQVREKIALNLIRFPAIKFQAGDYEQARKECKELEKPIIEEFYK